MARQGTVLKGEALRTELRWLMLGHYNKQGVTDVRELQRLEDENFRRLRAEGVKV